MKMANVSS